MRSGDKSRLSKLPARIDQCDINVNAQCNVYVILLFLSR